MTSTIKVNNIQNQCGANIINESSNTITIGASGDTIALASGASQTGFGRTGTVDWDTTPKTANFNATSGDGFFCNTTSGAITATLPSGAAGAIVSFADYAGTWQTNALTISPQSGEKIGSVSSNVTLSTEGQSVTFVYVDSTQGWINVQDSTSNVRASNFVEATGGAITTCGNFKIHTFTGPGTFTVTKGGSPSGSNTVDYLVVAGGGGGGNGVYAGGGGGAGGYRESSGAASGCYSRSPLGACVSALPVSAQGYPITVGGGAAAITPPTRSGGNGSNSIFSTITASGGGGGAHGCSNCGIAGGSGGGAATSACNDGGAGNTPPVSPPQGNAGGNSGNFGGSATKGGGGGGATSAGTAATTPPSSAAGPGGNGATSSINGTPTTRAGGGGGSTDVGGPQGTGGPGSGGNGDNGSSAGDGTANTGSGGGGGKGSGGGGGSGIVIIRYKFQ
jgi:hypothetical protein